jgi:hypothetical protein
MARLGSNEGKANVRQEKLQDARALAMVQSRIHGRSLAQIADEFNVSVDTVKRSLSRAERMDLTARYEDYLVGRLAPLAIGALEQALHDNDSAVAVKILESIGLIKKPKDQGRAPQEDEGDTWEAYLKVRKTRGNGQGGESAGPEIEDQGRSPGTGRGDLQAGPPALDGEIAGEDRQEEE